MFIRRPGVWSGLIEKCLSFAQRNPENSGLVFLAKTTVISCYIHLQRKEEVLHALPGH